MLGAGSKTATLGTRLFGYGGEQPVMLKPIARRFRRKSMDAKVKEALETGIGLYQSHWEMETTDSPGLRAEAVGGTVLAWCRRTMGQMRRPYGLDYVTLALAILDEENQEIARASFGVMRPGDFYSEGSAVLQLEDAIGGWQAQGLMSPARRLSAVMFSWGDITRELLVAG